MHVFIYPSAFPPSVAEALFGEGNPLVAEALFGEGNPFCLFSHATAQRTQRIFKGAFRFSAIGCRSPFRRRQSFLPFRPSAIAPLNLPYLSQSNTRSPDPMTDETILLLARQPHTREEGFRQLVLTYQQQLYQQVRRQVASHEDADDVLQNIFLKIFRHLDGFEGRSELFTWMYRIAQNEVINHHKKATKSKREVSEAILPPGSGNEAKAEEYVNMDGISEALESVVKGLPERQQMVFRMRYYDELSYKQIAEILQLTEGALKASFHHAVKKIEEEFRSGKRS